METPLATILTLAWILGLVLVGECGNSDQWDYTTCNPKLRAEVSADVTRAIGVFLRSNSDSLISGAEEAARAQVSSDQVKLGQGLIEPISKAVEESLTSKFSKFNTMIKTRIELYLGRTIQKLCIMENCCLVETN